MLLLDIYFYVFIGALDKHHTAIRDGRLSVPTILAIVLSYLALGGQGARGMPCSSSWIKALGAVIAGTAVVGLTACLGQTQDPELISGSEAQVVIAADLDTSPRPLAKTYCAQYGKKPMLRDTVPVKGNFLRGWATGTKVFIYTFECN